VLYLSHLQQVGSGRAYERLSRGLWCQISRFKRCLVSSTVCEWTAVSDRADSGAHDRL